MKQGGESVAGSEHSGKTPIAAHGSGSNLVSVHTQTAIIAAMYPALNSYDRAICHLAALCDGDMPWR